ncbi:MAG TPA: PAS domain S-box protein, partial [Stenomitos sp.]
TITHPDDTAADSTLYQELLAGSIPSYQMEKRYFHKQGYLVWGRLSVSLVRDPSGSLLFVVSMVEDITTAKRTEAALLHISKAVENASDAIAIADTLLVRFNYLNPAFYQMFGYTLEQLNGAGGFTILFPDGKMMHDVLAIAVSGQSWQGEVEMVSRNRSRRQIALRIDAIKDVTGEVVGTIAIHTDITERKQAEAALRRSYERAELLKQITSEIRSSLDPQHIFQATVTQLGEALLVNRCMIFLYESVPHPTLSLVAEYLETGYSSIEAFDVPVEENPHIQQVLATDRAIASTNVYTEPLLTDTLHLCRAMDIQSMLTIRTSYQGQPNGVLGLHQCDAYRYWTSNDIELLEAVAAQVGIALAHARLLEKEKYTAAQLAQQNLDLQVSNLRANTKAAELEQALQNLQETQAQLVQTEKMSNLGQLLAGVAHEINNPVSFITVNINYACDYIQDLLRIVHLYQNYYPQPAEEIKFELQEIDLDFIIKDLPKLLNSMKVGADRINQIVLSLRNFSRHDEDEMSSVDIHEGIDHTLMILRHRLKAKGGSPEIEVSKNYGKLPQVACYAGQLNQVFMNLISNAIDAIASRFAYHNDALLIHTDADGEIERISHPNSGTKPKIKICTETRDNHWVIIRIKDNGSGMTEEVKQKLFNPFFTTKPAGKGTGLGLSISYQIVVEKHGGNLQCISVPGQGTEFIIEVPIRHS